MIYKSYGKLNLSVSAVGFGGMRLDTEQPDSFNIGLLRHAFDKGINYFDTAPGYCKDRSESLFGLAFSDPAMKTQRDKFYVSTKGMPENYDTADKAVAAVEKSLSCLKCDYIDFYHVWCIRQMEEYQLAMRPGGQYEGLLRCKEKGLIKHIVVSSHLRGPEIAMMIEKDEFEGILLGFNILNFLYRWDGVLAASKAGMGVVAMNPLAGGIIPQREKQLAFLASHGETPTEAAIRFCVSCPSITVTLVGFSAKKQIDTACHVADKAEAFTADDLERIRNKVTSNMDMLCTGCGYCMGRCPKDIPVASYMQYYNDLLLVGKTEEDMVKGLENQKKYGLLVKRPNDAGACTSCGRCEMACTQHLDVIKRLETIAKWEKMSPNNVMAKCKKLTKRLLRRPK
jgi:predicted aldo/keto reductase-like oxidoreductase